AGKDGSLCWECGKSFATLEQLVLHFKAHKAEMVCNVCRITFRRVVSLRLHLANVHSDLPLRCPCGQALASLWALNQHLASHHSQQGSPKMAEPGDEDTSVSPPRLGEGPGALCTTYAASSAGDHTYNESDGGAGHTRTYAIRMRHTKMVTLGFSPEDLPEEARKKKLQIFMFRNVGLRRSQGGEEEEEDEEETGDLSSSLASKREEERDALEEDSSDGGDSLPPGDSDFNPEGLSGASSDSSNPSSSSCSSGNSSGSSYRPRKRRRTRKARRMPTRAANGSRSAPTKGAGPAQSGSSHCEQCGGRLHQSAYFRFRHMFCCSQRKKTKYPCADCSSTFPTELALLDHKAKIHHCHTVRMYACESCREVFPDCVVFRRHTCPGKATISPAPLRTPIPSLGSPVSAPTPAPSSAIPASIQGSAILTPVPGNPFPSSIQGSAILTTVHGNPRTVPIQGSAILTPVPGNQITASIQRSTILTSVPGNPIPASIQGSAILTPVLGNPKTASIQRPPAPGSAIPTPIQGTAILAPVPGNHIPAPIQGSTILASVRGNPVPAPIQRSAILTPVPGNLKPSPIQGTAILTPVQSNPKPAPLPTEPLKILALYASRGQGQRPAERGQGRPATFKCRECGASSRQPSLGICHRYLHRGWRGYRCPCGRVFVRRLHLLRHQVQHAEATRFVCAPCGRTFSGAQRLARHKTRPDKKRKRRRKGVARACRAPFTCDCGQPFRRPAAFMWHKIQNTRPLRRPARASVPVSGISS
uniref:C2H2-type domain-containing protein n=1 Tax=Lepisosteus oculatus TaxID=7918 RepID=W5M9A3_LEPOC